MVSSILPKNELKNSNFCPSPLGQKFFFRFLEELKKTKCPFEINWPLITLIFCHYFTLNLVRNLWISLELCQDLRDQSTICSRYFLHMYSPQLSIESGRHNNSLALIGRSSIHLCLKYSSYRVLNTIYKINHDIS